MKTKNIKEPYFSHGEIALWMGSIFFIMMSYLLFDGNSLLTLCSSLIGASSLIFLAKGNPFGHILMIVFSILYGFISYSFSYYGEMITYLGMTLPLSVSSLVSWMKNPFEGKKSEVKIGEMSRKKIIGIVISTTIVTFGFYFILKYFGTENLYVSTLSVATSFAAAYLTFFRVPYFALAYALNDIVLIALWVFASFKSAQYISVVVCFIVFLVNDMYGFINWSKMKKHQKKHGE
jgi:nicotinamide mononucleotide transporter PnuC